MTENEITTERIRHRYVVQQQLVRVPKFDVVRLWEDNSNAPTTVATYLSLAVARRVAHYLNSPDLLSKEVV